MTSTQFSSGVLQSRKDYKDTPQGQYKYWHEEIAGSQKQRRRWHKDGDKIVKRFIDFRGEAAGPDVDTGGMGGMRLNLFHTNVSVLQSMLYGNVPKIDVSRRFADPNDDVSRVAAEMLERLLNNDVEDNADQVTDVLQACLQDRLLPGLGCARVRYEVVTEEYEEAVVKIDENGQQVQEMVEGERVVFEDAPTDYFHWRDVLWGWSRTWSQIPWLAYRSWLTKDEVSERFGAEVADQLSYKRQSVNDDEQIADDEEMASIWEKAEIWEIWDKKKREVVFYSQGYDKILETREDPLGLTGFFPSPPFFMANQTTSLYSPTPDFHIARQLYNEIDNLQTRTTIITEAVKVIGVYDSAADGIGRMFKEGVDNQLIPVDSWAMFAEKGGIAGQIDWLPIADVVNALDKLTQVRDQYIELLYQVTGMSDVLRGQGAGQYEGTGQALIKAKFGSVRVQKLQDEFGKFASDLMKIKAEIICRHFDPATIAKRANIENSYDEQIAPQAIELLKDPELAHMRVKIKPESMAMVDYAQLKAERTEYITALATFMQSAAPLLDQDKGMMPYLLQLLQWGLSGFKGSQQIEGVLDQAIDAANKAKEQPQEDPAAKQQQMAMQMEQMKQQAELAKIQAKAAADAEIRRIDKEADIATAMASHQAKMAEIRADMESKLAEVRTKMQADILVERAQAQANMAQTQAAAESEMVKGQVETGLEIEKEMAKAELEMEQIRADAESKIRQQKVVNEGASDVETD